MKLALISAPNGFEHHFSAYHLALAQYLDDKDYREFYRRQHLRGAHIIVDNGAAELGASIDFEKVVERANSINADEIVMPDVLDDGDATLAATTKYLKLVPERQRVVVPQGKSWNEWVDCLESLIMLGCRTIAIAKRYEGLEKGRLWALEYLQMRGHHQDYDVHLLGCFQDPCAEITEAAQYRWVRGIDTAAPFAWAQHKQVVTTTPRRSYSWGDPFDSEKATENISILRKCAAAYGFNIPK